MKKLMMLAALLAMVLVAAAPALAQAPSVDLGDDNSTVQYGDEASATGGDQSQNAVNQCEQILDQAVEQENNLSGDQNATATANGEGDAGAAAGNDQDNTVTAEQVQYCVNVLQGGIVADDASVAAGGDVDVDGDVDEADAEAAAAASASAGELPATGGVSLLTLGAGALLVAGGLVARRIVR